MPITYEPISTTTLGSANGTITFSSIPSTYTDLILVLVGTKVSSGSSVLLRFNSNSNTDYSFTIIKGDGSTASSSVVTNNTAINLTQATDMPTSPPHFYKVDIFGYAGSTNKSLLWRQNGDNNGSGAVSNGVGLWRSTSAINRIDIQGGSTYSIGTTATLYGVKNA
jgi:hypothetical protein